jgi:hypothetical protein
VAVEVYRQLVPANAAAYLPNLATSLNNLSNRLEDVGRHGEAQQVRAEEEQLTQ